MTQPRTWGRVIGCTPVSVQSFPRPPSTTTHSFDVATQVANPGKTGTRYGSNFDHRGSARHGCARSGVADNLYVGARRCDQPRLLDGVRAQDWPSRHRISRRRINSGRGCISIRGGVAGRAARTKRRWAQQRRVQIKARLRALKQAALFSRRGHVIHRFVAPAHPTMPR